MPNSNLMLDTCALIWLVSGSGKISQGAMRKISEAEIVYVSAISAWEISLKVVRNKLELPKEPKEWFEMAIECHNLYLIPLDLDILIQANNLPWHHRDPADRFIIASSLRENVTVVTADNQFNAYDIDVII